jgi:hypothetical protein
MRIDEISRELHRQGDEVAAGPPPSMAGLRARRRRHRRSGALLAAAATVVVLGGTAAAIGQAQSSGRLPAQPAEQPASGGAPTLSTPDDGPALTRSWKVLACNPRYFGGCRRPLQLSFGGEPWNATSGGSQPAHAPNGLNRSISLSTQGPRGPLLALVGARGAGPGSHLVLVADGERVAPLPTGRLSAWRLPGRDRPETLTVRDIGRPAQHERMIIELYVPAP